jgi:hypothetical protein
MFKWRRSRGKRKENNKKKKKQEWRYKSVILALRGTDSGGSHVGGQLGLHSETLSN